MQHVLALAQIDVDVGTTTTGSATGSLDASSTTVDTTTSSSSMSGSGYGSGISGGFSGSSSSTSTTTTTSSGNLDFDASGSYTQESHMSAEIDIDRYIDMYDPLRDHLTILQFSYSLDATLEVLVKKILKVGKHIEKRTADIKVMRKQINIISKDVKSLQADIKVIQNTESDVRLRFLRVQKQITDLRILYDHFFDAAGDFMARITWLEDHRTQAFIDIDVLKKSTKNV